MNCHKPDDITAYKLYPFGSPLPTRTFQSEDYRYGFNSQEKVDEISGTGNHNTAEFGELDTRLGRRWNLDPKPNPSSSNYSVFANSPIWIMDAKLDTPTVKEAAFIDDNVYDPKDKNLKIFGDYELFTGKIPGVILHDETSGYDAEIYTRTNPKTNEPEYVFANRGTESVNDILTDLVQPFGLARQFDIGVSNALAMKKYFGDKADITYSGHSLGGGIAAAQAMATNSYAITFNASGLGNITKARLSENFSDFAKNMLSPLTRNIDAYIVSGEILNKVQFGLGLRADGRIHYINTGWSSGFSYDISGFSLHTMGAVKSAIANEEIK